MLSTTLNGKPQLSATTDALETETRPRTRTRARISYNENSRDGVDSPTDSDFDSDGESQQIDYAQWVKEREYPSTCVRTLSSEFLDVQYLNENGFDTPLFVEGTRGLGIQVPKSPFTVNDVVDIIGDPERQLEVFEVGTQKNSKKKWTLKRWADYYSTPFEEREKIYNVISLEFSRTRLARRVVSPQIVREIDWIDHMWPTPRTKPLVQKYCLMGVKNSYTDFHVDFGGTSVWYHVVNGRKDFFFIPPTEENLKTYKSWANRNNQSHVFLGDHVRQCYRVSVYPGNTLFIPSGWIHAVYTPEDSLVFGGNFLHAYAIKMQLQVYGVEVSMKVRPRFQFPKFERLMWFAAQTYHNILIGQLGKVPTAMLNDFIYFTHVLRRWTNSSKHKEHIPNGCANPLTMLDDLESHCTSELKRRDNLATKKCVIKLHLPTNSSIDLSNDDVKSKTESNKADSEVDETKPPSSQFTIKIPLIEHVKEDGSKDVGDFDQHCSDADNTKQSENPANSKDRLSMTSRNENVIRVIAKVSSPGLSDEDRLGGVEDEDSAKDPEEGSPKLLIRVPNASPTTTIDNDSDCDSQDSDRTSHLSMPGSSVIGDDHNNIKPDNKKIVSEPTRKRRGSGSNKKNKKHKRERKEYSESSEDIDDDEEWIYKDKRTHSSNAHKSKASATAHVKKTSLPGPATSRGKATQKLSAKQRILQRLKCLKSFNSRKV
eukprot:CFRG5440T1